MAKKTKVGIAILVLASIFVIVFMAVQAFATDSKYLNIIGQREGNETYKITSVNTSSSMTNSEKTIWKIVSYDSMQDDAVANYDEAIYCINPEIGFGSATTAGNDKKEYDVSFNMKDLSSVEQKYKDLFKDQTKYNSMLWILEHSYLPKQVPEEDRNTVKERLLSDAGIDRDVLTDNDIEVIQQIALWYFSSDNLGYHYEPDNFPSIAINDTAIEEIGKPLTTEGLQRYNDMKKLYTYFITSAKENASLYGTSEIRDLKEPNFQFTKPEGENVTTTETIGDTEYFISGPYYFEESNHTKLPYTFEVKIVDQNEEEITDYKLLDTGKNIIENDVIDSRLMEKEFYIAIPTSNKNIMKLKVQAKINYMTTTITCWTSSENYLQEQPVAIIEKEPHEIIIEKETDIEQPEFDLALRKFITQVNDKEITSRIPQVDVTGLKDGTATSAEYTHPKDPVAVQTGDIVIYTIRIYNEGEISGYAKEITDDIPDGLKFLVTDPTNIEYMWRLSEDGTKITTNYLSLEKDDKNEILAFDPENMETLHYKDVKVAFEVVEPNTSDNILTNIAEISEDTDSNGDDVTDRDSIPGNNEPEEDDIDEEHLKLEYFDLALRKFITQINDEEITSRIPQVDLTGLIAGTSTTAIYSHPKDPIGVQTSDRVIYTIRVYNEGKIAGYAEEITDYIPEGLKFVSAEESEINAKYKWIVDEDGKTVTTNYLSEANSNKESTSKEENFLIEGFDKTSENPNLDYRDVLIEFEVTEPNTSENILRNIAEITEDSNNDTDSTPGNVNTDDYTPPDDNSKYQEDDDDYEQLKLQYFDLALRKFITNVNGEEITDRVPEVSLTEDGKLVYTHTKEPVLVANNNIVVYTIRVYNEGKMAGYAKEITDDIPNGLSYLPEHEINKKYEWNLSEDGKSVSTDYLSKEKSDARGENNLINPFDTTKELSSEGEYLNPDYRDVQIAFKVTELNLPTDRIIINTAEITDDSDEDGKDINDEDSIPGNNIPDEDDIDKEYLKVKYFDLSLLKWVSKVYITENGETTIRETGHTGLEDPEPIVKVDLDRKKLDEVTVKFGYVIKITNEGEIAGYAKEVSDYIPEGLTFLKEDNPDWEEKDGKIVTRKLENTLLQPGESATVEVILTWINDDENLGLKVNIAEISEDYNEDDAKDIDSTPDNQKEGEDDIDDAPVMLTVKTGNMPTYITLILVILLMLASGIILIKKYVLN